MRTRLSVAFVLIVASVVTLAESPTTRPGAAGGTAAPAERYPVLFDRPLKVGDRFSIKSSVTRTQDALAAPEYRTSKAMSRRTGVELTAACEVLAVSPSGMVAKARVTIERASLTLENGALEELEPGTVIQFTVDKGRKFINGEKTPLATLTADALIMGLPLDEVSGGPDGQKIYGPAEPKAVGDVWRIDAKRCAGRLLAIGLDIDPGELKGACKLADAGKLHGEPCVKVLAKMRADHLKMGAFGSAPIPDNFEPADGSIDVGYTAVLPTDPAKHILTWTDNTRLTASFKIRPRGRMAGGTADVVARVKRRFEVSEAPGGGVVASPLIELDAR